MYAAILSHSRAFTNLLGLIAVLTGYLKHLLQLDNHVTSNLLSLQNCLAKWLEPVGESSCGVGDPPTPFLDVQFYLQKPNDDFL